MKIAVIDCGTNTFNLLVAEVSPSSWNVIFQSKLPVKLGAGGFEERHILPARFVRGLDALLCHKTNIKNFSCEKTFAFATSGIREATNGQEFIDQAKSLFDVNIELISGDREAELIYDGVNQTIQLDIEKALIMDIGGGSTEFIIADGHQIFWKKSFLLGVSRLNDLVTPEDRMTKIDLDYLKQLLDRELEPLAEALKEFNVSKVIGSSGSFDTLLMLHFHKIGKTSADVELANEIPIKQYLDIHRWLVGSSLEERIKHPSIPSMRAEYMPLASCLVKHILEMHRFSQLYHSAYSLKEGAMLEILKRIDWPQQETSAKDEPAGESQE